MTGVFTEARVVNPPARVLGHTDDGVWSGDLFYWLRSPDWQWWGNFESISHSYRRRGIVAAAHLQPLARQQVHVKLDDKWQPGHVLGWRTTGGDSGGPGWEALVEVKTPKCAAIIYQHATNEAGQAIASALDAVLTTQRNTGDRGDEDDDDPDEGAAGELGGQGRCMTGA